VKIDPPKPKDLTWPEQQSVFAYGTKAIVEHCQAQPMSLWCSPVKLKENPLTAWEIMNLSLEVKENFRYLLDVNDNWRVHTSSVMTKNTWQGDCDDLAVTTLDVMIRYGLARDRAWLVLADVQHTDVLDHLIGMVQDIDGKFWIVGDTSSQNAYPVDKLKYRVVGIANMSDPSKWVDPHTVDAFPASTLQSNPIVKPAPKPVNNLPTSQELLRKLGSR
jgi:predicted transglutaminase-like cysteine proteinase